MSSLLNLKTVGVLAHPHRPQSFPVAEQIAATLRERDIETWLRKTWDEDDVLEDVQKSDMVVAIGGDGAMLKAGRVCAPFEIPVLGINMGRLGFLTEIASPDDWGRACDVLIDNQYWIETRMMVRVSIIRDDEIRIWGDALNDVVVSGDHVGSMIQLHTYIDNHWTTTYNADSVIIATPTGSTAYALAVGGPILPPDLANILIIPAAAHLSLERPIILSEGSIVNMLPSKENRPQVTLRVDGMELSIVDPDERIQVQASPFTSRFIRLRERNYFYRSLLDRLEPRVNQNASQPQLVLKTSGDL